jgi:serine/threonine protein phosphatase PrpC
MLIGSDGIFDKLESKEVSDIFWYESRSQVAQKGEVNFDKTSVACGKAVDRVLTAAMQKESFDNISVIVIAYKNLLEVLAGQNSNKNAITMSKNGKPHSKQQNVR